MIFLKKNKNIFNSLILNFNYKNLYKIPLYRNLQSNYTVVDILFNNTRLISFNTSKYNNLVLTLRNLGLISLLEKVYGKRVEIKLIDLKSLHLSALHTHRMLRLTMFEPPMLGTVIALC